MKKEKEKQKENPNLEKIQKKFAITSKKAKKYLEQKRDFHSCVVEYYELLAEIHQTKADNFQKILKGKKVSSRELREEEAELRVELAVVKEEGEKIRQKIAKISKKHQK